MTLITLIGIVLIVKPKKFFKNENDYNNLTLNEHVDLQGMPYSHEERVLGVIINLI